MKSKKMRNRAELIKQLAGNCTEGDGGQKEIAEALWYIAAALTDLTNLNAEIREDHWDEANRPAAYSPMGRP